MATTRVDEPHLDCMLLLRGNSRDTRALVLELSHLSFVSQGNCLVSRQAAGRNLGPVRNRRVAAGGQ
eukprot:6076038-Alexandrium_andersonii.AAC.1